MIAQRSRPHHGLGPWAAGGWVVGMVLATIVLAFTVPGPPAPTTNTFIELYTAGLVVRENGTREPLPPEATEAPPLTKAQAQWLAQGSIPGEGTRYESMARQALIDIDALALPVSATAKDQTDPPQYALIAAWHERWHYVWPRDAAFAAAALARTGHLDQAWGILSYLQDMQSADGTFEARYLPDGSTHTPDNRAPQSDGVGWLLWAAQQVLAETPPTQYNQIRKQLEPLITRATSAALRLTSHGRRLPPISPDYWEVREYRVTLGTAAPLLMALEAAAELDQPEAAPAAARYRELIVATFGSQGYPRHRGWVGTFGSTPPDTAVSFIRPPFIADELAGAAEAWHRSQPNMKRSGGGLAPGGSWRNDGISWTPTTSVYAMVAACTGDKDQAVMWLDWLFEHRTLTGSLPEKVLSDGSPAAVAPLAWTSANVLLALDCLEQ